MYEMEGPRPVSRHRPADCSASFAPLDRLPGPVTLTGVPVAQITGGSGVPLAGVGQSFLIADGPELPPRRRRKVPLRRWLRVPPLAGGPRFPLRRVARGFLAP